MNEEQLDLFIEALQMIASRASDIASDIAYARRTIYEAYLLEGFSPAEALELCKML